MALQKLSKPGGRTGAVADTFGQNLKREILRQKLTQLFCLFEISARSISYSSTPLLYILVSGWRYIGKHLRAFNKGMSDGGGHSDSKDSTDIKIRLEETFIKEVFTKRIQK